jgi:hypothetical protein
MPNDDSVNPSPTITIKYSLTRMEIVASFLRSLAKSPRLMLIVIGPSLLAGFGSLAISSATLRRLDAGNAVNACGLALGIFCLFIFLVFVQGKTQERTLTVSEEGLSTSIGKLHGTIPWARIAAVKSVGQHVLILRSTGNSFLIPARAFKGSQQYVQFLEITQVWLKASR